MRRVRPASTARTREPASRMATSVPAPTTGTSKRMSWRGFDTLTTVVPGPAMRPARRIVSSVPSIASSATAALCFTTAVWPRSIPASARATVSPYRTSFPSSESGCRRVIGPASASWSARNATEGSRVMPSRPSASATAPIRLSVFWKARRASTPSSFRSGTMPEKIRRCLTCPAMIASRAPACCRIEMARPSWPRPIQWSSSTSASSSADGLLPDGQRHDPPARAAGARRGEEGKAAVAGDEPSGLARPRRGGVVPHGG